MRRKLVALNGALALLAIYAGWQLRQTYRASKARETATLAKRVPAAPPPPWSPLPAAPPVVAGSYANVVQQTLFDRSRSPVVPIEVPPAPPPPPPKPVPPLPVYHGMMNLGGITVVLSLDSNSPHQGLQIGDSIGQFKLVSVNTEEISFEWDGQTITKKLDELKDHAPVQPQQTAQVAAPAPVRTEPQAAPAAQTPMGPGNDVGSGYRSCQANDSNPDGAVVDGFRKVVLTSPFGPTCRWEPVR
ncbi:MAG TPA: hypothetical protein VKT49_08635 [Bryobacteraceae bacterium]|nr:hypothetical protein [Bryobacteraceae bacterium]